MLHQTSLGLLALLLALLSSGCASEPRVSLQPIPGPTVTKLVYVPLDSGLTTCSDWPTGDVETDLDAVGMLNQAFDAWADCYSKVDAIRLVQP